MRDGIGTGKRKRRRGVVGEPKGMSKPAQVGALVALAVLPLGLLLLAGKGLARVFR